MDRYWLLTSTFYGNWLPGDPRGFVSRVRDLRIGDQLSMAQLTPSERPRRLEHDIPGTPCDADMPGLFRHAQDQLKGPVISLTLEHAEVLVQQLHETAGYRGWQLLAVAVMENHTHLVVGVPGDPDPEKVLGDFKAYGSRALNRRWGKPPNGTWWTYSGSKRKLADARAVRDAIIYVRDQWRPLIVWLSPEAVAMVQDRSAEM
jgi:REP element-mobilizing transposase RayT